MRKSSLLRPVLQSCLGSAFVSIRFYSLKNEYPDL
jgi:hypothetical protein